MERKKLKIVGFLARSHGLEALKYLLRQNRYDFKAVFTHSLAPKSECNQRKERLEFLEFKELALKNNISLYSVDSKKDKVQIDNFFQLHSQIDLILSISWRMLIPNSVLECAKFGGINLHRGRLPDYPGAEPIKQALNNEDGEVSITAHVMTDIIDGGEILGLATHKIDEVSTESLDEEVAAIKKSITPLFGPLAEQAISTRVHK